MAKGNSLFARGPADAEKGARQGIGRQLDLDRSVRHIVDLAR
jgi:hypothetical protein